MNDDQTKQGTNMTAGGDQPMSTPAPAGDANPAMPAEGPAPEPTAMGDETPAPATGADAPAPVGEMPTAPAEGMGEEHKDENAGGQPGGTM